MKKLILLAVAAMLVALPAGAVVIEDFEDGNITEYTYTGSTIQPSVTATAAHDGSYGLQLDGLAVSGEDWMYRDDAAVQHGQGDVISCWVKFDTEAPDLYQRAYFGFGATAAGCYSIVLAPNTGEFHLYLDVGYGYLSLADALQTWVIGQWYRVEADWGVGGSITANLYDSDGVTLLNSVNAVDNTYTSGGIAFRYFDGGTSCYFDTVTLGEFTPVEESSWGAIKAMYR